MEFLVGILFFFYNPIIRLWIIIFLILIFVVKDKDKGWRLDYVLADENFMLAVEDSEIHNDVIGSDHCPVSIKVNLKRLQEIQNKSKL